jgi:hypothetical protein
MYQVFIIISLETEYLCLFRSLFRSLFVQMLVVKEFACLDVTSCNKLNEINCLISFSPIVSPTVTDGIYQNKSMPLPNSNITKHALEIPVAVANVVHQEQTQNLSI